MGAKGSVDTQMLGIAAEQIAQVNVDEADVVSRQLMSRVKDIMMTVYPDGVSFNCTCIRSMIDVVYIQMLVDRNVHRFYVKPADEYDKDSFRWCLVKNGRRESRKLTGRDFADRMYTLMNWCKGYYYKIGGSPALQVGTSDEYLMVFELDSFDKYLMTEKGLISAGVYDEDLGKDAEMIHFEIELQAEEKAMAKELAAQGKKKRKPSRKKTFQKDLQEGGFGVQLKDHVNRIEVPPVEQLEMISAARKDVHDHA